MIQNMQLNPTVEDFETKEFIRYVDLAGQLLVPAYRMRRYLKRSETWLFLEPAAYWRRLKHLARLEAQYVEIAEQLLALPTSCYVYDDTADNMASLAENLAFLQNPETSARHLYQQTEPVSRLDQYRTIYALKKRDLRVWFTLY